jgi:hypothetical protein
MPRVCFVMLVRANYQPLISQSHRRAIIRIAQANLVTAATAGVTSAAMHSPISDDVLDEAPNALSGAVSAPFAYSVLAVRAFGVECGASGHRRAAVSKSSTELQCPVPVHATTAAASGRSVRETSHVTLVACCPTLGCLLPFTLGTFAVSTCTRDSVAYGLDFMEFVATVATSARTAIFSTAPPCAWVKTRGSMVLTGLACTPKHSPTLGMPDVRNHLSTATPSVAPTPVPIIETSEELGISVAAMLFDGSMAIGDLRSVARSVILEARSLLLESFTAAGKAANLQPILAMSLLSVSGDKNTCETLDLPTESPKLSSAPPLAQTNAAATAVPAITAEAATCQPAAEPTAVSHLPDLEIHLPDPGTLQPPSVPLDPTGTIVPKSTAQLPASIRRPTVQPGIDTFGASALASLRVLIAVGLHVPSAQSVSSGATLRELFSSQSAAALSEMISTIAKELGTTPANIGDMKLSDLIVQLDPMYTRLGGVTMSLLEAVFLTTLPSTVSPLPHSTIRPSLPRTFNPTGEVPYSSRQPTEDRPMAVHPTWTFDISISNERLIEPWGPVPTASESTAATAMSDPSSTVDLSAAPVAVEIVTLNSTMTLAPLSSRSSVVFLELDTAVEEITPAMILEVKVFIVKTMAGIGANDVRIDLFSGSAIFRIIFTKASTEPKTEEIMDTLLQALRSPKLQMAIPKAPIEAASMVWGNWSTWFDSAPNSTGDEVLIECVVCTNPSWCEGRRPSAIYCQTVEGLSWRETTEARQTNSSLADGGILCLDKGNPSGCSDYMTRLQLASGCRCYRGWLPPGPTAPPPRELPFRSVPTVDRTPTSPWLTLQGSADSLGLDAAKVSLAVAALITPSEITLDWRVITGSAILDATIRAFAAEMLKRFQSIAARPSPSLSHDMPAYLLSDSPRPAWVPPNPTADKKTDTPTKVPTHTTHSPSLSASKSALAPNASCSSADITAASPTEFRFPGTKWGRNALSGALQLSVGIVVLSLAIIAAVTKSRPVTLHELPPTAVYPLRGTSLQRSYGLAGLLLLLLPAHVTSITAISNANIVTAVNAWMTSPSTATTTYGNIVDWNTAAVTSMASLFSSKATFNDDLRSLFAHAPRSLSAQHAHTHAHTHTARHVRA